MKRILLKTCFLLLLVGGMGGCATSESHYRSSETFTSNSSGVAYKKEVKKDTKGTGGGLLGCGGYYPIYRPYYLGGWGWRGRGRGGFWR